MGESPQAKLVQHAWHWLTRGWRKWLTYPAFFVFLLLGIVATGLDNAAAVATALKKFFQDSEYSSLTAAEQDALNNWVMLIEATDSREQAVEDARQVTQTLYSPALIPVLASISDTDTTDVLIVRDPMKRGRWLVVVDMLPGAGTYDAQQEGISRIAAAVIEGGQEQPVGRWVMGRKPYLYSQQAFERTYGPIDSIYLPATEQPGISDKISKKINKTR
jgi:hypothetical protein